MFVRNCWYMAGWSRDFAAGSLFARTLLGEALVFYRRTDGGLVALDDRCCHRLAPLSLGKIEGDDLRCMYHGLRFGPDGQCKEIPQQTFVSKAVRVRAYPVIERHSAVWIWMGDFAQADADAIPAFVGHEVPEWAMKPDSIEVAANYALVNDNLLDLSHVAFVHRNSFGAGDDESSKVFAETQVKTTQLDHGVRVERRMTNSTVPPYVRELLPQPRADFYISSDHLVPGIFLLNTRCYPLGTFARYGEDLSAAQAFFAEFSCQAVTPIDAQRVYYFFALGPWSQSSELRDFYLQLGHRAFGEDRAMLEAQQRVIDRSPGSRMMNLAMDGATVAFRSRMEALLCAERTAAAVISGTSNASVPTTR